MAPYPKIDPSRVAFDFDGVFADTMQLYLDIAREEFQVDWLRYDDIVCYSLEKCLDIDPGISERIIGHILDGSYKPTLKPIEGAPAVLSRLAEKSGSCAFRDGAALPGAGDEVDFGGAAVDPRPV